MPFMAYVIRRVLIWTKTYPELSTRHIETVCTAGVLEDGSPVRLYPIQFRYLDSQFHKYQWITAKIAKNPSDARPESHKVDPESIECGEIVPTTPDEWGKRAEIVFRNRSSQFDTMEQLLEAQKKARVSLGVVTPRKILNISILQRGEEEAKNFEDKMARLRKQVDADRNQLDLFEASIPPEMKRLDFLQSRARINWLCNSQDCGGHDMQILDWEIAELQRRHGDQKALEKLREICNLENYALRFFLGNLFQYPTSFTIVGLWYPKRQRDWLFS